MIETYKQGNKNNWRRWEWNRIADRLKEKGIPTNKAVVLYLPGNENLDRPIAQSHGFVPNNLIAVERDLRTAQALRKTGVLVIHSDLSEAILNWPPNKKVDVIVADFQCGITKSTAQFLKAVATHPSFEESIISVNMLRGRDPWSNEIRFDNSNHRGENFIINACQLVMVLALENGFPVSPETVWQFCQPRYDRRSKFSYKSKKQYFDSIIYNNMSLFGFVKFTGAGSLRVIRGPQNSTSLCINAINAVRTRRLNLASNPSKT